MKSKDVKIKQELCKSPITQSDRYEYYFDYATSAREETMSFAEGLNTKKQWLKLLYWKPAKKFAKSLLNKHGVKGTRRVLSAWYTKEFGHNGWKEYGN